MWVTPKQMFYNIHATIYWQRERYLWLPNFQINILTTLLVYNVYKLHIDCYKNPCVALDNYCEQQNHQKLPKLCVFTQVLWISPCGN